MCKIFCGLSSPLRDSKEGWHGWHFSSRKIGKEGWNHEKRAKTAKISEKEGWRGLEVWTPPEPQNFTPPPRKKTGDTYAWQKVEVSSWLRITTG